MTVYNRFGGNMASKNVPTAPPVLGLHHSAYRCRDAEETRHFYEDIQGLPLVQVVTADHVSTGKSMPFAHVFFELADGSCIAFFDLGDNVAAEPSPNARLPELLRREDADNA
jgi:glyoxylase I family protein